GCNAHQHDQANVAVDIERAIGQEQPQQRTENRQWHCGHDYHRVNEAFELRRQHQEYHHQRHADAQHHPTAGLLELQGLALVVDLRVLGQILPDDVLQEGQPFVQADARGEVAADGNGTDTVIATQLAGTCTVLHSDQVAQRYELTGTLGAHIDVGQVAWGSPL